LNIEWLKENCVLPSKLRMDRGTETGTIVTIHAFLRASLGDVEDPLAGHWIGVNY